VHFLAPARWVWCSSSISHPPLARKCAKKSRWDKALIEQEATKFDQAFEQKWRPAEGKESKKGQRNDKVCA